jgi:hypothetical protein
VKFCSLSSKGARTQIESNEKKKNMYHQRNCKS